jgi:hypothetical protein
MPIHPPPPQFIRSAASLRGNELDLAIIDEIRDYRMQQYREAVTRDAQFRVQYLLAGDMGADQEVQTCMTSPVPPRLMTATDRAMQGDDLYPWRQQPARIVRPAPPDPPPGNDPDPMSASNLLRMWRERLRDPLRGGTSPGIEPHSNASPKNDPSAGATTMTSNLLGALETVYKPDLISITDAVRADPVSLEQYERHNAYWTKVYQDQKRSALRAAIKKNMRLGNLPSSKRSALYEHNHRRDALQHIQMHHSHGRRVAKAITVAKKDIVAALELLGDDPVFGHLVRPGYSVFEQVVPEHVRVALDAFGAKVACGDWRNFPLAIGWGKVETFFHAMHVSTEDPTMLAYARSIDALLNGKFTKIKPGRYLTRFYSDVYDEKAIKDFVETFNIEAKKEEACNQLQFKENTDPDGWEWVYEHAHGFSSCMMYNHPSSRHIDSELHGINHPVRAYAYAGNGLRLAYIGDEERVYARSIVNEDKKTYVRVYGDGRLALLLRKSGYRECHETLDGVKLAARVYNGDMLIVPYLDGDTDGVDWTEGDDYMVATTGCADYTSSASGYVELDTRIAVCEDCDGDIYSEDEVNYVGVYEDRCVCNHCLSIDYTRANVYNRNYGQATAWIHDDNVIYCETDGESYREGDEHHFNVHMCSESGKYYDLDDLVDTSRGLIHPDLAVQLDRPDLDGNDYAHKSDTVTVIHEGEEITIHEDCEDEYPEDEEVADEKERLREMRLCTSTAARTNHEYHPHYFDKDQDHDQATIARAAHATLANTQARDERFCLAA